MAIDLGLQLGKHSTIQSHSQTKAGGLDAVSEGFAGGSRLPFCRYDVCLRRACVGLLLEGVGVKQFTIIVVTPVTRRTERERVKWINVSGYQRHARGWRRF